jgi:hypothetical protein
MECLLGVMGINMKESGIFVISMVKELTILSMEILTGESIKMVSQRDKGFILGQMDVHMKDVFKMD